MCKKIFKSEFRNYETKLVNGSNNERNGGIN